MSLKGSVDATGFLDVLQLLDAEALDGHLQVVSGQGSQLLLLAEGRIGLRPIDCPRRIAGAGLEAMREHLFDLLGWRNLTFRFWREAPPQGFAEAVAAGTAVAIGIATFAMEGRLRLERWHALVSEVPTEKLIAQLTKAKAWITKELLAREGIPAPLARFDGRTPIGDVVAGWPKPRLESLTIVAGLIRDGLLQVFDASHLKSLVEVCLAHRKTAQALVFYEAFLETVRCPDRFGGIEQRVLARDGVGAGTAPLAFEAETSGKRALRLALSLLRSQVEGTVTITHQDECRQVTIDADVVQLVSHGEYRSPPVARYLVRRGALTSAALEQAEAARASTRRPLRELLIEGGAITQRQWVEGLAVRLIDEISEAFFWPHPRVTFRIAGTDPPEEVDAHRRGRPLRLRVPLGLEGFPEALEAAVTETEDSLARLPSVQTVLVRTESPKNRGADLVALFDGKLALGDVLRLLRSPRHEFLGFVARALAEGRLRTLAEPEARRRVEEALEKRLLLEVRALCRSALLAGHDRAYFEKRLEAAQDSSYDESKTGELSGACRDLPLSTVVQHLHQTKQSGTLTVLEADPEGHAVLYLLRGEITLFRPAGVSRPGDGKPPPPPEAESFPTFWRDLDARGAVDLERLQPGFRRQIAEELEEPFAWRAARFVFRRNSLPIGFVDPSPRVLRLRIPTEPFLIRLAVDT